MKEVATALARLHSVPMGELARAGFAATPDTPDRLLSEIDNAEREWTSCGGPVSVSMAVAFDWLRKNIGRGFQGRPSLTHGDVRFHNILFDGDRLTAILDWELARISYPAADLGYIRPSICRVMPWQDFMQAYEMAGGPTVSQDQVDFYAIWSNLSMSKLSAQVKKLILDRRSDDIELTAVCLHDINVWTHELAEHLLRTTEYS
jgi:aminoglycoside phosphotransferase (APT) family kinase protein